MTWLYRPDPVPPSGAPKLNPHLSPFSIPALSNHPLPSGSVIVSLCSWLTTLITESAGLPLGDEPDEQPGSSANGWLAYNTADEVFVVDEWYAAEAVEGLRVVATALGQRGPSKQLASPAGVNRRSLAANPDGR